MLKHCAFIKSSEDVGQQGGSRGNGAGALEGTQRIGLARQIGWECGHNFGGPSVCNDVWLQDRSLGRTINKSEHRK